MNKARTGTKKGNADGDAHLLLAIFQDHDLDGVLGDEVQLAADVVGAEDGLLARERRFPHEHRQAGCEGRRALPKHVVAFHERQADVHGHFHLWTASSM
jgi:hypothetical protein